MQEQEYNVNQTHNLVVGKYLQNQQIKYTFLCKLDTFRSIYTSYGQQYKFLINLILVGRNFIQIYSIYQPYKLEQLGKWKLHQNIKSIFDWDRNLIILTNKKIVGLFYQDSMLKNAFMLSLEFLPINQFQNYQCIADKVGFCLIVEVKGYLLICISDLLIQKYRSKPLYKSKTQLITQDIIWNRTDKLYIEEIVKINITQFDFNKIYNLRICDQSIYFIASHNNHNNKSLYVIHLQNFFIENNKSIIEFVGHQDAEVIAMYPIHHAKEIEYLMLMKDSIAISHQQKQIMAEIDNDQPYKLLSRNTSNMFPLCLVTKNTVKVYKYEQNKIIVQDRKINTLLQSVQIHDKIEIYCTRTQVILYFEKQYKIINEYFGSIIDFQIVKNNIILIDSYNDNLNRIFEIQRNFKIDYKPYVTHNQKIFLQSLQNIQTIKSIENSNFIYVEFNNNNNNSKYYCLYKQQDKQLILIKENILWICQHLIENKYIIFVQQNNTLLIYNKKCEIILCKQLQFKINNKQKIWILKNLLIYKINNKLLIYNYKKNIYFNIKLLEKEKQQNLINIFLFEKKNIFKKKDKDYFLIQITFCYEKLMEIYQFNTQLQQIKLCHRTLNIGQGPAICFHTMDQKSKNRFRSITCTEYILSDYSTSAEVITIKNCQIVQWQNNTYLLMVNSEEELLLYKKYLYCHNDIGYIYKRINLPLMVTKLFKYKNDDIFLQQGWNVLQCCNFIFYHGNFLHNNKNTKSYFQMDNSIWILQYDKKIRMINFKGKIIQNCIANIVETNLKNHIIGIQSTNLYYCIYSPYAFQVLTKDLMPHWRPILKDQGLQGANQTQTILCIKAFEHYIAMSYYNLYQYDQQQQKYQSIKFKFRIYNAITKNRIIQKQKSTQQPILHIKWISIDKLILVTSSNISVNLLKNDKSLELIRTRNFSRRTFLSSFCYLSQIMPNKPGYMLFGGIYGGLSFSIGKWIENDILRQQWFEIFRCGIKHIEFLHYGQQLKALIADQDNNLIVLNLKADKIEKLTDFNLRVSINNFRIFNQNDNCIYLCCQDGTIKIVYAVKLANINISFLDFQESMCKYIPFLGGFNLRVSRILLQQKRTYQITRCGNMIDPEIVQDFFTLTHSLKQHLLEVSQFNQQSLKKYLIH